jgi:antitoxin MazE6
MKISRSRLFALALEEFINRRENEALLEQINQAVEAASGQEDDLPDADTVRRHMRRMAQDEW